MNQPNADQHDKARLDLEEAEAYLWSDILTVEAAWPEHYREAVRRLAVVLAKHLDAEGREEVLDAAVELAGAAEGVQLRIGFSLGRTWTAYGELTEADCCRAVEQAGGNPGRALMGAIEHYLFGAGVIE